MSSTRIQTFSGDVEVLGSFTGANLTIGSLTNAFVARGTIALWHGSEASIPTGWAKCNGSNGTPDLQNRFVTGATSNRTIGTTGGNNTLTLTNAHLPVHSHTGGGSTGGGSHYHNGGAPAYAGGGGSGQGFPAGGYNAYRSNDRSRQSNIANAAISYTGSHNHNYNTPNNAGAGQAFDNRPAYMALYYIMKL